MMTDREATTEAPRASHLVLAAICLLVGMGALVGGTALVVRPDGSAIHLPLSVLEHAPFETFLVPGVILFAVIGVGSTFAGARALRGSTREAAFAGLALLIWIVTQMVMLQSVNALQLGCLGTALAILTLACVSQGVTTIRPSTSPRLRRA